MSAPHFAPIISLGVTIAIFYVYGKTLSVWIASKLRASDAARHRFAIVISLVEVLLIGGCIEAADLSEAIAGNIQPKTDWSLACLFPLVATFVISQRAMWFHDTSWRLENRTLAEELAQSKESTDLFVRLIERDNAIREADRLKGERLVSTPQSGNVRLVPLPSILKSFGLLQEVISYPSLVAGALEPLVSRVACPSEHGIATNPIIRATLFIRNKDRFQPIARYQGSKTFVGSEVSLKTLKRNVDAFKIDQVKHCLVVATAFEQDPQVVPNTVLANSDESCSFHFTYPEQSRHAQSIVCFPIRRDQHSATAAMVLAVDANVADVFSLDRKGTYGILCATLNARFQKAVVFEELLKCLAAWVESVKGEPKQQ